MQQLEDLLPYEHDPAIRKELYYAYQSYPLEMVLIHLPILRKVYGRCPSDHACDHSCPACQAAAIKQLGIHFLATKTPVARYFLEKYIRFQLQTEGLAEIFALMDTLLDVVETSGSVQIHAILALVTQLIGFTEIPPEIAETFHQRLETLACDAFIQEGNYYAAHLAVTRFLAKGKPDR
ncbi:MAG TPA: hypothetical protein VMV49_18045, partial [Candidatus Deferrimicrobium sp.]|nr:hypothetical protein [Candidatus Deferrimicrobium sp.]